MCFAWARSKLQSFTAPKSVMGDLPVEDASGEVHAPDTLRLFLAQLRLELFFACWQ